MTNFSQEDLERAIEVSRGSANTEFRARTARYLAVEDMIEVMTTEGERFAIDPASVDAFKGLSPEQLGQMEVWLSGAVLEIEAADIQVNVHGLLTGRPGCGLDAVIAKAARTREEDIIRKDTPAVTEQIRLEEGASDYHKRMKAVRGKVVRRA